jgi:hypothetical protein
VAETTYTPFAGEKGAVPVRLIVRRVRPTPGSQLALLTLYEFHAFITDRDGQTLDLEADHRRHAEIENAIRDLKYGVALNHLPSGKFGANGAWLAVGVIAHTLARWTARIGVDRLPAAVIEPSDEEVRWIRAYGYGGWRHYPRCCPLYALGQSVLTRAWAAFARTRVSHRL